MNVTVVEELEDKGLSRWDESLATFSNAGLFHQSLWIKIVCKVYQLRPHLISIERDQKLCLIPGFVKSTFCQRKLFVSMPFNFSAKVLFHDEGLLKEGVRILRDYDFQKILINDDLGEIAGLERVDTGLVESILTLSPEPEAVQTIKSSSMYRDSRRRERRSREAGFEYKLLENEEELSDFFRVYAKFYRDQFRMVIHPYSLFNSIRKLLVPSGNAEIHLMMRDGKVVGGLVILKGGNFAHYCWGAYDVRFKHLSPLKILLMRAIESLLVQGYQLLSLGTSPTNNTGLRFFKRQWGAEERMAFMSCLRGEYFPVHYDDSFPFMRSLIPFIPLPVFIRAMPIIVPKLVGC